MTRAIDPSQEPKEASTGLKVTTTVVSAAIVAGLVAVMCIVPSGSGVDHAVKDSSWVSEQVSTRRIQQVCPAQMQLTDTESYGDAEFQASTGNLTSHVQYAAMGSIFHSQVQPLSNEGESADATVLDGQHTDTDSVVTASSDEQRTPTEFETRLLTAQDGTGAVGALASYATKGDVEGISGATCARAALTQSFLVPATTTGNTQQLVVMNPEDQATKVTVEIWGSKGQVASATNSTLAVGANSSTTLNLSAAASNEQALYVRVQSSNTAVSSVVRSVRMDGLTPKGSDFVMPLEKPATEVTMPWLGEHDEISIMAYSEQTTAIKMSWITNHGLKSMHEIEVEAHKPFVYSPDSMPKDAVGVVAYADTPFVMNALTGTVRSGKQTDFAMVNGHQAMKQSAVAVPHAFKATVAVANTSSDSQKVEFQGIDASGSVTDSKTVELDANSADTFNATDLGKDVVAIRTTGDASNIVWGIALENSEVEDAGLDGVTFLEASSLQVPQQTIAASRNQGIVH
ncbi:hypothetical protein D2E26_0435 [Bifidobacterium dolichotidis]|uniref:Organic solvents resistance ABC transporter permease n=1 Tax=Bifidobacterium dolichotidis TaxID=2306976 RepID=A0A430FSK7_9BIFI|nr:DUF5719 family protein [Bifidobacterium dolichotidis]RSX55872.1 hypothetical protein D2E26_0435 [Bifidobacterium dolichotidis]